MKHYFSKTETLNQGQGHEPYSHSRFTMFNDENDMMVHIMENSHGAADPIETEISHFRTYASFNLNHGLKPCSKSDFKNALERANKKIKNYL